MFTLKPSAIQGCFELQPKVLDDARGRFVKVFQEQAFAELGLETVFVEEYYSVSHQNVLRGMHFQLPPADQVKMVYCVHGEIMDVVVDLRIDSSTYGQFELFELSAHKANSIYIPKGMAHGFCVRSESATMVYRTRTTHSPECDTGILWSSVSIPWPTGNPIISFRDQGFVSIDKFLSPFYCG